MYSFPAKIIISSPEENLDTSLLLVFVQNFDQSVLNFGGSTQKQLRVFAESKDLYEKEVEVNVQLRK